MNSRRASCPSLPFRSIRIRLGNILRRSDLTGRADWRQAVSFLLLFPWLSNWLTFQTRVCFGAVLYIVVHSQFSWNVLCLLPCLILRHGQGHLHRNWNIFCLVILPSCGGWLMWSHIILHVCSGTNCLCEETTGLSCCFCGRGTAVSHMCEIHARIQGKG